MFHEEKEVVKHEEWPSFAPARHLRSALEPKTLHVRSQALRYFLEFEDKGRQVLVKRRKKNLAARLVLAALDSIERHVSKEDRSNAVKRVRHTLLDLAYE